MRHQGIIALSKLFQKFGNFPIFTFLDYVIKLIFKFLTLLDDIIIFSVIFYNLPYRKFYKMQQTFTASKVSSSQNKQLLWKTNDSKAQKNGPHSNIYWVKKQPLNEDGSQKNSKWVGSNKYVGDWLNNKKHGFGIQYFANGNKYEGGWQQNKRHGQGTFWVADSKNKLRREYTGDWQHDQKQGRGTMFYQAGGRYDGMWMDNLPHGEGRMIYKNGDVYQGMWFQGKRSGYGVLTKRCGDHFEGHWVNDMRQGQGSYFFSEKNKIFVGQWVADTPKAGVYSQVEDPSSVKIERQKHFSDPYQLPALQQIGLMNPTEVLEESIEKVRRNRIAYRAKNIPLDELYTKNQLLELERQFGSAVDEQDTISQLSFQAILNGAGIQLEKQSLVGHLRAIRSGYKDQHIDYQLFVRTFALVMQLQNLQNNQQSDPKEQAEEKKWYNQQQQ